MMALRLVMLLVAVALIYAMFMRSQSRVEALPPELVQSTGAPSGKSPERVPDQYKAAMDRANAAAAAMKKQHADADSF